MAQQWRTDECTYGVCINKFLGRLFKHLFASMRFSARRHIIAEIISTTQVCSLVCGRLAEGGGRTRFSRVTASRHPLWIAVISASVARASATWRQKHSNSLDSDNNNSSTVNFYQIFALCDELIFGLSLPALSFCSSTIYMESEAQTKYAYFVIAATVKSLHGTNSFVRIENLQNKEKITQYCFDKIEIKVHAWTNR